VVRFDGGEDAEGAGCAGAGLRAFVDALDAFELPAGFGTRSELCVGSRLSFFCVMGREVFCGTGA
jgi:hypothetical protein